MTSGSTTNSSTAQDGDRAGLTAAVADSFFTRLGDQIDDRVALAFDEQLEERLEEARPSRAGSLAAVCAPTAAGATVTIFAPHTVTTLLITWAALVLISLAYFLRRSLRPARHGGVTR